MLTNSTSGQQSTPMTKNFGSTARRIQHTHGLRSIGNSVMNWPQLTTLKNLLLNTALSNHTSSCHITDLQPITPTPYLLLVTQVPPFQTGNKNSAAARTLTGHPALIKTASTFTHVKNVRGCTTKPQAA